MPSPTFETHTSREHGLWNYLFFIQYLKAKDPTEYSGVESYVNRLLQEKNQDWIPARTSFSAVSFGLESEEDGAMLEKRIAELIQEGFGTVGARIGAIEQRLGRIEARGT